MPAAAATPRFKNSRRSIRSYWTSERPVPSHGAMGLSESEQAQVLQAHIPAVADDDVVQELDAEDLARLFETAGDVEIVGAGSRIAGRMVVRDDDAGGGGRHGIFENLPGVGDGRGKIA